MVDNVENNESVQANSPAEEQSQPTPQEAPAAEVSKDAKTFGMLCHLLGLISFIGPLIIWMVKKNDDEFIDDQGKEALNWQITVAIAFVAAWFLCFVLIGFLLMPIIGILNLVFLIIGAIKANDGEKYRYPFCIRLIK